MAKLRVTSTHSPLEGLVAEVLRADGHEVVAGRSIDRRSSASYRSRIDPALHRSLLGTVAAFEPDDEEAAELEIDAFGLEAGPLVAHELHEEHLVIGLETSAFLRERRVDLEAYPFVYEPEATKERRPRDIDEIDRLAQPWLPRFTIEPMRPHEIELIDRRFVSSDEASVHIGRCVLERFAGASHPSAPSLDDFRHYCVDSQTADLLLYVACAVSLGEPCLLEGATGSGKTSAVLYLAALLGQPVLRLDLRGHTDAGELVERYMPAEGGGLPWHDGLVVRAICEGHWLLLENIDLAEPQVVERLHSVLERRPSPVIGDHDGERMASEAAHPRFRVLATTTRSGRACSSAITQAIVARFRTKRWVDEPSLLSVHAFLRFATEGEVPEVELGARRWAASKAPAPWPELSGFAAVRTFTDALASLHVAFTHALAASHLEPRGHAARHAPTRRTLISVLDLIAQRVRLGGAVALEPAMWEAIERHYVGPTHPSDRTTLIRQLDAHGLDERMLVLGARAPAGVA
jgi:MoxR-like ATPase